MKLDTFFNAALSQLKDENRYRVFANLERRVGAFPTATYRDGDPAKDVTVWCSNDYLGMRQPPDGLDARRVAARYNGTGAGGPCTPSRPSHPRARP